MTTNDPTLRWIRPPQQARSQHTLDRILDAAEALVADKGFEDTSVAEVARRAGSSVGAFYARFRDKDGLLYALHERFLDQAVATADDALDPERWKDASIAELLSTVVHFLVEIYREQAGLMRAFVLRNYTDFEFRSRQERLSHYVGDKLTALLLQRRSEIRHPHPEQAAAFGLTMAFATIESAVLFGETRSGALVLSDETLAEHLIHAYLAHLGVPAPEAAHPSTED